MPEWWRGRKHSEETKEKMRLAKLGSKNHFFGRNHDELTKKKISENRSGKCTGAANPTYGKPRPVEVKSKISETRKSRGSARGENNPMWRGGVAVDVRRSKRAPGVEGKLQHWREQVLRKANFVCEECGSSDRLHAHHVKGWYTHPKLRFRTSNGRCLCHSCHSIETVKETKRWQKKVGSE